MNANTFLRRFFAFIIDWNIMFGVFMALMLFGPGSDPEYILYPSFRMFTSVGFLLGLCWLPLYGLFKDCIFGRRSLGKLICGLVIINSATGERASYGRVILRNLTYCLVEIEGIILLLNEGERIGDILAKTQVVSRRKDAKA